MSHQPTHIDYFTMTRELGRGGMDGVNETRLHIVLNWQALLREAE